MTNYADLDDNTLRLEIAKRVGWTIQVTDMPDMPRWDYSGYIVVSPSGDRTCYADEEEAVWGIPNWPKSADDALTLIPEEWHHGEIKFGPRGWIFNADPAHSEDDLYWEISSKDWQANLARSISLAWLEWMDAKDNK